MSETNSPNDSVNKAHFSGTAKLNLSLNGEHHEITANPKETILDAALRSGIDVPYSCMSGTCNSCQARLAEGKVEMEFSDALTEEELAVQFLKSVIVTK